MSWMISNTLMKAYENSRSLPELAAESLEENSLAGELSALSSGVNTLLAYCAPDKMKAFSRLSRFGMTFRPLTDDHGAALLTWYLAGSPARTSAWPARAPASRESVPACGATWRGSLARFDPASLSWKTAQRSLLGDSELSSVTWPRSGMTAAGQCWELPTLGRTTSATASGWWPTPTTQDNVQVRGVGAAANAPSRGTTLGGAVRMWQTPVADDAVNRAKGKWNSRGEPKLSAQVLCTDEPTGGQLNPMFVEWLMGFPPGWTELSRSETPKCPCALQPLGDFSASEIN